MKIFELEINNLPIQILAAKNDVISIENSSFCESQVLTELLFRYNFQFSIFILQESSNGVSFFPTSLRFLRNLWHQELLFNHILKEC